MGQTVLLEIDRQVATLTLHEPARRNAVSHEMNEELLGVVSMLEGREDVGALVITGSPPAFCAGADLEALGRVTSPGDLRALYTGFARVAASSLPTVAAVNGPAVGAGMNMALSCDVIIAGESANFDSRFLQIGIHPGGGHTWRLAQAAGERTARAMVLFGETLDGRRSAEVGLAWRCVADSELLAEAMVLAQRAAAAPRALVKRTKMTLASIAAVTSSDGAIDLEIEPQEWSSRQPDFQRLLASLRSRIRSEPR